MKNIVSTIKTYGSMIKFSHTIFALPFAMSAVVFAFRYASIDIMAIFWITLAMAGARSAAMGFNRIVDQDIDGRNPRTSSREIPSGRISLLQAWIFVLASSLLFIFAAFKLGDLCFYLSFPVLFILCFYSYTKRFTSMAHIYLGFAISLAPSGAFIALTNSVNLGIILLSLVLFTYISGFDILYACQDIDFDREQGLFSIPSRFGEKKAFWISGLLHLVSFFSLLWLGYEMKMGVIYYIVAVLIGGLLTMEHVIVRPGKMEAIDMAFFNINSIISIFLFCGIFFDELFYRWI